MCVCECVWRGVVLIRIIQLIIAESENIVFYMWLNLLFIWILEGLVFRSEKADLTIFSRPCFPLKLELLTQLYFGDVEEQIFIF